MTESSSRLRSAVRFLVRRVREDELTGIAGSLTFTTLFALVPLITVVFTVFSALPVSTRLTAALNHFVVSNFVPGAATKLITAYTQQFVEKASHLTALGIAVLAVTAIMLMLTIDDAFNRIWRVRRPRPLMQRLLVYWTALTIGPVLIGASVYLTSTLITFSVGLIDDSGARAPLWKVASMLLTVVALGLLYRTVPNRPVSAKDATIGAVVAGLAFEAMKAAFAWFVIHLGQYKLVYGAFAGFPVFLLWIYMSWLIVLAGAVITSALPSLRTGIRARERVPGVGLVEALLVLRRLHEAHIRGEPVTGRTLAAVATLALDDTDALLDRMVKRGWIARAPGDRWLLARDPRHLELAECYDEFVYREADLERDAEALGIAAALPVVTGQRDRRTLDDAFGPAGAVPQPEGPR